MVRIWLFLAVMAVEKPRHRWLLARQYNALRIKIYQRRWKRIYIYVMFLMHIFYTNHFGH